VAAFDSNGPPVNAYANKLYRRLKKQVAGTGHEPNRERRLDLNSASYPAPVTEAIVVVGHVERTRPKTRVVYRENWGGSYWECRWGRHENDHNADEHFHQPPSPDDNEDPYAYDAEFGVGVLMMEVPAEFIYERLNALFAADEYTYPSEYEWSMEHRPDKYHLP
jgi:hypothetical protein